MCSGVLLEIRRAATDELPGRDRRDAWRGAGGRDGPGQDGRGERARVTALLWGTFVADLTGAGRSVGAGPAHGLAGGRPGGDPQAAVLPLVWAAAASPTVRGQPTDRGGVRSPTDWRDAGRGPDVAFGSVGERGRAAHRPVSCICAIGLLRCVLVAFRCRPLLNLPRLRAQRPALDGLLLRRRPVAAGADHGRHRADHLRRRIGRRCEAARKALLDGPGGVTILNSIALSHPARMSCSWDNRRRAARGCVAADCAGRGAHNQRCVPGLRNQPTVDAHSIPIS